MAIWATTPALAVPVVASRSPLVRVFPVGPRAWYVAELRCGKRPSTCRQGFFRTDDAGRRYRRIPAPPGPADSEGFRFSTRFVSGRDGVTATLVASRSPGLPSSLSLWVTHTAGRRWRRLRVSPCSVPSYKPLQVDYGAGFFFVAVPGCPTGRNSYTPSSFKRFGVHGGPPVDVPLPAGSSGVPAVRGTRLWVSLDAPTLPPLRGAVTLGDLDRQRPDLPRQAYAGRPVQPVPDRVPPSDRLTSG